MTRQMDRAYRDAREAMVDVIEDGTVDAGSLQAMRDGLRAMAPHKQAFGAARFAELQGLLKQVEHLPIREPVFVRHPPVINHRAGAWHHQVPYPYQFKIDGGWIFVL